MGTALHIRHSDAAGAPELAGALPDGRLALQFFLMSRDRGGVEEVVVALLRRLAPGQFRFGLVCPTALLERLAPDLRDVAVETHPVDASWTSPRGLAALAGAIRRFRPQVVNPHLFRSTLAVAPLARALRVPAVVETYHGREAWRRGWLRGRFEVDRCVSACVDRVIAVSEAAARFLVEGKGIPREKVEVIPNGRDLERFSAPADPAAVRRELGLAADALVVGVVGRLDAQKGHRFALEAFARLEGFGSARLLLVGDGALRAELERQATGLGIRDRVTFAGFRADVPRLLSAMDVVALPSLHEGMPLTAIEAGAAGRPMVATDVDGTGEVIADGATGILVPPADPDALASGLARLLGDVALRRRMGREAQVRVRTRFDLETQVRTTAEAYRRAAVGREPGLVPPAGG